MGGSRPVGRLGVSWANICNFFADLADVTRQLLPPLPYRFSPTNLPPLPLSRAAAGRSVDVLSYNVNFSLVQGLHSASVQRVLDAILTADADIVCLQETNAAWEERLASSTELNARYSHRHFHHPVTSAPARERPAGGSAIISRWPIRDASVLRVPDVVPGSVFPALLATVECPVVGGGSGILSIVNVHLRPPVELDGAARLDTARNTEPIRCNEIDEIWRLCSRGERPLDLAVGDFNEQDGAGALSLLATKRGMPDALEEFVPKCKETHLWPFFGSSFLTLRKRLDHVAYRPERMECIGCGVLTGFEFGASDHLPVLARFIFHVP